MQHARGMLLGGSDVCRRSQAGWTAAFGSRLMVRNWKATARQPWLQPRATASPVADAGPAEFGPSATVTGQPKAEPVYNEQVSCSTF